jgi:glutamate-5-semialdehyde dehydrogenase
MKMPQAKAMIAEITSKSKAVTDVMSCSSHDDRNAALKAASTLIRNSHDDIMTANKKDVDAAKTTKMKDSYISRLTLDTCRIEAMAKGLEDIAALDDPLGRVLDAWERPNGLKISRVATPLGVLGVIYEARPNVTVDAAGLAIKSGNAVVLRGGSSSIHSSSLLADLVRQGLANAGLPQNTVQLVDNTDRLLVGAMLQDIDGIDVIIPRGGKSLVAKVQDEARVPVFAHLEGICHVYIDKDADPDKANAITLNAKMRRVEICGAAETLLVHRDVATTILPDVISSLIDEGCEVRGCAETMACNENVVAAREDDWITEYLDRIIAVKVVNDIDDAMAHIRNYSSDHTEAIITENEATAEHFLSTVDSAIVMVNASTQFADGGEFGMGAEIGISTGRMHARGPVGAQQLTSFKYLVRGSGQTRP